MLKKGVGLIAVVAMLAQMLVIMPVRVYGEESYTYEVQNEDFSNYGMVNGDEVNASSLSCGYNGSASVRSLTYKQEQGINYIECINEGGNPNKSDGGTFYFWRNFKEQIAGKVHIEYDARFKNGDTSFAFMSSSNPTSWPPTPVTLKYDSQQQALMYGDKKVADVVLNQWSHITVLADLEAKTVTIKVSQNGEETVLADQGLLDESALMIQCFVTLPKGPSASVDITNITMGYIQSKASEKGVIVKNEYPETVAENQALIDNYQPIKRQMEDINRGVVAVQQEHGVFVSWRWLATESIEVSYNLYRDGQKVNGLPIEKSTNFLDTNGTASSVYTVRPVVGGVELEDSEEAGVWQEQYLSIPLQIPQGGTTREGVDYTYSANDASVGDLDGDGEYEIVLKWDPSNSRDNMPGFTGPHIFQAYEMDGTPLWTINMGPNIIAGPHYTQFIVYDLDSDGKAEIAMRTSDGTIDGEGNVIGSTNEDYWTEDGAILSGNEYLTIFEGETGKALESIPFEPARGDVADWGDTYGNRVDRFLATVAYLDGDHPSLVMTRGYYEKTMLAAYDWQDGHLTSKWIFDTDEVGEAYMSQGNHQLTAWDVDYDGKDEITYGAMAVDHDGSPLYSTGLGHGDALHVTDIDPSRPGYEVFQPHEHTDADYGIELRDARTGEVLWGSFEGADIGRGVAGDIDPYYYGAEAWGADKLISCDGDLIKEEPSIPQNFMMWWDGDLGREFLDQNRIDKWDYEDQRAKTILIDREVSANNSTKSTPVLAADLIGDWREEVIWRTEDSSELRLYTTTEFTDYRMYTLMQDPLYRMDVAWQNVGYNQPPHVSFYFGYDTEEIPVPQVYTMDGATQVVNPDLSVESAYALSDLTMQDAFVLKIGSNVALYKNEVILVDDENLDAKIIGEGSEAWLPLNFVEKRLQSQGTGLEKKVVDGVTYVRLSAVASILGKSYYCGGDLIVIRDESFQLSSEAKAVFMEQIDNAVYVADEEDTLYQGPRLREDHLEVVAVDASAHDGNLPEGAVDSDFATRWSSYGVDQWLMVDLGEVKYVKGVAGSFYKGNERSYSFNIEVSTDKLNWVSVLTNAHSSGTESGIEEFLFDNSVDARYIRYVGKGNTVNPYNNIWEFLVLGDMSSLIIDRPTIETEDGTPIGSITNGTIDVVVPIKNNSKEEVTVPVMVNIYKSVSGEVQLADTMTFNENVAASELTRARLKVTLSGIESGGYIEIVLPENSADIKVLENNVKFYGSEDVHYLFDFGNSDVEDGYIGINAGTGYDSTLGYGFNTPANMKNVSSSGEGAQKDAVRFVTSGVKSTNTFDVDLPNGLYEVKVTAGDIYRINVAAESVFQVINMTGNNAEDSFQIPITDGQLNLLVTEGKENTAFSISELEITKISDSTTPMKTIYIGGDSTVCNYYPLDNSVQAGWGQMLTEYVDTDNYQVRNMASGGQCARGFRDDGQFEAIMKYLKPGDFFILQLGINDTNPKNETTEVQFKQIMKDMVQRAKETGATVIISTPQGRATDFTDGVHSCESRWYRASILALAEEEDISLIDLNVLSSQYYTSIGAEATLDIYMDGDTLHPNREGATQLARIVSEALSNLGFGDVVK